MEYPEKGAFEMAYDESGKPIRPKAEPTTSGSARDRVTPEMRAIAEALAHPKGDPYENGRKLGFYCENCG